MKKILSLAVLPIALYTVAAASAEQAAPAAQGAAAAAPAAKESRYGKQKVVYHFNTYDDKTQLDGLRNIQNHINAVGKESIEMRVVMHGDGLSLLLPPDEVEGTKMKQGNANDQMQALISGLKDQGVKFDICANTLKGRNVEVGALYDADEADIVPSGVAELSRLQGMGYTYVKP